MQVRQLCRLGWTPRGTREAVEFEYSIRKFSYPVDRTEHSRIRSVSHRVRYPIAWDLLYAHRVMRQRMYASHGSRPVSGARPGAGPVASSDEAKRYRYRRYPDGKSVVALPH